MIKRLGIITLAVLYTITVAGFALNFHYCGNTVAAIQINAPAKGCAKPMAKTKMRCCKDTKLEVKVKDDHQAQQITLLAKLFISHLPQQTFLYQLPSPRQVLLSSLADRGPPPDVVVKEVPVFLKNCTFRI